MAQSVKHIPEMTEFQSLLKKKGLKATVQRLAVHRAMMELWHGSAEDVEKKILEQDPDARITQSSIYNILTQLADAGIYRYRLSANNKMYFDASQGKHIHLYDTVNHTFRDLPTDDLIDSVIEKLSRKRFKGYKIEGVDINILLHPKK